MKLLCWLGLHAWTEWDATPTRGFNIAWVLVDATLYDRKCLRCEKYESYSRANR